MSIELTQTASARGTGKLTGDALAEFAKAIPGNAVVEVTTRKAQDQRDNDSWTMTAQWQGSSVQKPTFAYRGDSGGRNDA